VEFCQHLLPEEADVAEAARAAQERGWGLTLLLPYGNDALVGRVEGLIDAAREAGAGRLEFVASDWGVLRRLLALRARAGAARAAAFGIALGRGLDRAFRDPRLPDVGPEHIGGDEPPSSWRQASHGARSFRLLIRTLGVDRLECDLPLQGLDEGAPEAGGDGVPLSLHLPFGMVATGRVCMVSGLGKTSAVRFAPVIACDAPCRRYTVELRAPWSRRVAGAQALPLVGEGEILPLTALLNRRRNSLPDAARDPAPRFLQKGNTHFYRHEGKGLPAALDWAWRTPAVDRVVVAPDLPM
jgi:hypothetical protein